MPRLTTNRFQTSLPYQTNTSSRLYITSREHSKEISYGSSEVFVLFQATLHAQSRVSEAKRLAHVRSHRRPPISLGIELPGFLGAPMSQLILEEGKRLNAVNLTQYCSQPFSCAMKEGTIPNIVHNTCFSHQYLLFSIILLVWLFGTASCDIG